MTPSTPAAIRPAPMTAAEAKRCVERIRAHFDDARSALLELHQREGWRALKYASWRECVAAEFGMSWQRAYQLLTAARIEAELSVDSTTVEKPLPERVLRELVPLETPAERQEVFDRAAEDAGGVPTGSRIAELVRLVQSGGDQEEIAELIEEEEAEAEATAAQTQAEEDAERRARDLGRALERARQSWRILGRYGETFAEEMSAIKAAATTLKKKLTAEGIPT